MRSQPKYNLEDKSAKRQTGKEFEVNNCPNLDNSMKNSRFFINFNVLSISLNIEAKRPKSQISK